MAGMIISGLLLSSVGIFFIPKNKQYFFSLFIHIVLIIISGTLAINVLTGEVPLIIKISEIAGNSVNAVIDQLSAFFIIVIDITVLTGILYAKGYLNPYQSRKTKTEFAWHYFNFVLMHLSMILTVVIREGISFLVSWEMMSVSTFFLILFESEKKEVKDAGIKFIIQMHIALMMLVLAFIISSLSTGEKLGFDSLETYFNSNKTLPLFLLFFVGFGIKSGFIPFHTWLPHAHPAAPSHISGVMSGVIIKMGIYGVLRVLTYIHHDLLSVGLIILIMSVISGILGVVIAIVQHDFKKLLAYHSIENIGIIGIGIGTGTIGLALNLPVLASLGFAGGLLHVFNHSLFKSLLFYTSGSVYQQTHTRQIDQLGGLMKKMPKTAILFLIGALAISGLPPFNGFISEFLIYSGLFKSLIHNNLLFSFLLLGGIVSLVVIGGLAVFCFTKIFSIIFLGNPRSDRTAMASEVKQDMLLPGYIIAILIIAIGLFPSIVIEPLSKIVSVYVNEIDSLNQLRNPFEVISVSFCIFVLIVSALIFIKIRISKKREIMYESTWGCGYTGANPAIHQYTATSYAGYIEKKAKLLVGVKKHFTPLEKDEIFPSKTEFKTENSDVFEDRLVLKPVNKLLHLFDKMAIFQTGNIQDYLLYAILFVIFISVMTILNLI